MFSAVFPWRVYGDPTAPLPDGNLRLLFIRSGGIGDSIIALGALRAIALRYPGSVVDILGAGEMTAVCRGLDFVGQIMPVHRLKRLTFFRAVLRVLRSPRYDVVIDGYTPHERLGFSTALIMAASRARMRIGRSPGDLGRALTHLAPPRGHGVHFVDEMFDVAEIVGVAPGAERRPTLSLTAAEQEEAEATWQQAIGVRPRVLINIAAGHSSRHWDADRYLEVARDLRRRSPSARIVVIGHGQPEDVSAIAAAVGGLALATTFRRIIAVVARADLVITPDTSISHLAAAFDRIVVSLHQSDNFPWVPYKARGRALFSSSFFTIRFIDAATVCRAVAELLDREPELR
jgi:ADP-heptose:LPS heptosyltransferase